MGPPGADEVFDGAGVGNNDVAPGNLGTVDPDGEGDGGDGDFVQPGLSVLAAEFSRAHVSVDTIPESIDDSDDIAFVHNLPLGSESYGNLIRNVPYRGDDYWCVQVLAGYEFDTVEDGDDAGEDATMGITDLGATVPVHVFLETIRTVKSSRPAAVDTERLRQRVVLHEVMHKFRYLPHDQAIMNYELLLNGSDEEVKLTAALLETVESTYP